MELLVFFFLAVALAMAAPAAAQLTDQDKINILAAHNAARRDVGMVDEQDQMVWDEELERRAQEHTNRCKFEHEGIEGSEEWIGQNLAWSSSRESIPQAAVDMWVGEKVDYDYNTNSCAEGRVCGHYTQVVWRSSTSIGCGLSPLSCGEDKNIIGCYYRPGGNYADQRPY